jgi:preprotein translocase subunit SecG
MLKFVGASISLFLIGIIFLRIPRDSIGLASFANTSNLLGSPSSAHHFLNVLTVVCILLYFGIAVSLNLEMI